MPSRHLALIVTLDGAVEMLATSDPSAPAEAIPALIGGLHATPTFIKQSPVQHGIQLELTSAGSQVS